MAARRWSINYKYTDNIIRFLLKILCTFPAKNVQTFIWCDPWYIQYNIIITYEYQVRWRRRQTWKLYHIVQNPVDTVYYNNDRRACARVIIYRSISFGRKAKSYGREIRDLLLGTCTTTSPIIALDDEWDTSYYIPLTYSFGRGVWWHDEFARPRSTAPLRRPSLYF